MKYKYMSEKDKKEEVPVGKVSDVFKSFVENEKPEMTQEEEIKEFQVKKAKKAKKIEGENQELKRENEEDEEELKRIKTELLKSLERVKELARKLYGGNNKNRSTFVEKQSGKQIEKGNNEMTEGVRKKVEEQEKDER